MSSDVNLVLGRESVRHLFAIYSLFIHGFFCHQSMFGRRRACVHGYCQGFMLDIVSSVLNS